MTEYNKIEPKAEVVLSNTKIVSLITAQQLFFAGLGVAIWYWSGRSLSDFVTIDGTQILYGVIVAAGFVATMMLGHYLFPAFMQRLLIEQGKSFSFLKKPFNRWQIILLSIGAGVGEEALFRAGIQTLFSDYMFIGLAILLASILFGLLHLHSRAVVAIIVLFGCIFGVIYYLTGSLLTVMIAHILYDIWAIDTLQVELEKDGFFDSE